MISILYNNENDFWINNIISKNKFVLNDFNKYIKQLYIIDEENNNNIPKLYINWHEQYYLDQKNDLFILFKDEVNNSLRKYFKEHIFINY
jgi:hypothetical protein